MKKLYKGAILFIILLFLIGPVIDQIPSDHNRYKEGVQANLTSNFDKPMFFYVGAVFYSFIGDYTFLFVPMLSFFLSYMFIYLTFRKKELNTLYIPVLFFASIVWMGSLWLFMRDSLLFFFSAAFLYFIETDKVKYLAVAGLIVLGAALTKVGGLLLVIPFIFKLLRKYICFPFISYLPSYYTWIEVNINDFIRNFQRFPFAILAVFINPVMAITFLSPNIYTILYIIAALHIGTLGYDLHHVYRYTLFLMPFGFVRVAEIAKKRPKHVLIFGILLAIANYLWFFFDSDTLFHFLGMFGVVL